MALQPAHAACTLPDGRRVMWHKLLKDTLINTSAENVEKSWECKVRARHAISHMGHCGSVDPILPALQEDKEGTRRKRHLLLINTDSRPALLLLNGDKALLGLSFWPIRTVCSAGTLSFQ